LKLQTNVLHYIGVYIKLKLSVRLSITPVSRKLIMIVFVYPQKSCPSGRNNRQICRFWSHGETDKTKLIVAFRYFGNAPKTANRNAVYSIQHDNKAKFTFHLGLKSRQSGVRMIIHNNVIVLTKVIAGFSTTILYIILPGNNAEGIFRRGDNFKRILAT
jgi:hypothetical protein